MAGIFGELGLADSDRSYIKVIGQQVVYDAAMRLLARYNAEMTAQLAVFLERTTEVYKLRYKLPGGGRLQRRSPNSTPGAVKAYGYWDVALPLEDFAAAITADWVSLSHMRIDEFNNHLNTIMIQDVNTVRFEMLRALFYSTARTFTDPIHGSLTIQPLANGDGTLYPPVLGSESEADDTHYAESGYLYTAISDTNNPIKTCVGELEEHFGASTGGDNIIVFCNNQETPYIEELTDFDPVNDRFTQPGANMNTLFGLPTAPPGRTIGRTNGAWIQEWRSMPAAYLLAIYVDAPRPLMQRVDPADTGIPRGLTLVYEDDRFPLQKSTYMHRFGFGVGNRLSAYVLELGTGGTYTVPTVYQ